MADTTGISTANHAVHGSITNFGFNTPFKEQLDFFKQKVNLPTEKWNDIIKSAHDKAFIVAGAANADMLNDFNQAIENSITEGKGIQEFRKDFKQIVQKYGWTGWTGEGSAAGEAWRTRVIYQTNMATSYAAGRWAQLTDPEYLKIKPNWRYVHMDGLAHPRPLHESWNGVTLPHDHEFWKTHFAPNGWGCHCRIVPVSRRDAIKQPPHGWNKLDPKTGALIGIDKGFDYAPGANVDIPIREFVQNKLITYQPAITRALTKEINKYIDATTDIISFVESALDTKNTDTLWLGFVENYEQVDAALESGQSVKGYLMTLPADSVRHHVNTHQHDGAGQRVATPEDYKQITSILNSADSLRLSNEVTNNGLPAVIAVRKIDREIFRAVFEVQSGKKSRIMAFKSLVIKTDGG